MSRHTLIAGLLTLGAALWLSSLVVDSHPQYAMLVVLAVLAFAGRAVDRRG